MTSELSYYDDQYAIQALPAEIYLAVLMLVGFVGNSLVCYVYIFKFKPSTTRCFITSLALLDLLNCLLGIPFEISLIRYHFTAGKSSYCRVVSTITHFTSVASGTILLATASDRFRKICKPFRRQLTPESARIVIPVCCVVALTFSLPSGFLNGAKTVTADTNLNGSTCTISDETERTIFPLMYNIVLFCVFLISSTAMIILYVRIKQQISHQTQFRQALSQGKQPSKQTMTFQNENAITCTSTTDETVVSSDDISTSRPNTNTDLENTGNKMELTDSKPKGAYNSPSDGKDKTKLKTGTLKIKSLNTPHRKTLMLFLVTLVFVLSFLPYLCLKATTAINTQLYNSLEGGEIAVYNLFLRSYFINSAANPILYSFLSIKFRGEVKKIFRRH